MKTIIREISKWTSILISVLMLTVACGDDKEDGAPEEPVPAAPTITNFVPPHGVPGVTITITGADLKEVSEVTIGGKEVALVGEATDTEIKVMTTEEVTGGKIKVTTPYGTAETVSEFVVDEVFQAPSLITVPQDNVSYLDTITLEGENLDIVEKVFFGNVEAKIIREDEATRAVEGASGTELKVEVPYYEVAKGESVNLFLEYTDGDGQLVKKDTEKSFTVTPRAPRLENVSSLEADFFESVSLEGTDLNLVEKVLFGTAEATIDKESSNNTVLKVTVPYYEEEEAVKITLIYRYGEKDDIVEGRKSDSADEFAAKKVKPENVECPASVMFGTATFEITGDNLDKVEKVLFNETEITSTLSDDKMKLICSLPSTVEASTNNAITIVYWQENKKEVIRSDFEIKELHNYIWKNVKLYSNATERNYFSVTTGKEYTIENYEEVQNEQLLLSLTNKWKESSKEAYIQMSSLYSSDRLGLPIKFRRIGFNTSIDGLEQGVIDFIKGNSEENVENTLISWNKMKEIGYDSDSRESSVIRYKLNDDAYNEGTSGNGKYEGTKLGQISAIILRTGTLSGDVSEVLGIGFVELVSVDADYTQEGVQNSSWTVNVYFPKNILENIDNVIRK